MGEIGDDRKPKPGARFRFVELLSALHCTRALGRGEAGTIVVDDHVKFLYALDALGGGGDT
jgi:hypothetical protein